MATKQLQALADVQNEQTKILKNEYQGKMSNQFVEELKSSTLFQCDWGELLSAAPTALSLMGACWIAASQEKADAISLTGARPNGGWKYLKNYDKPTLRSCLVDGSWISLRGILQLTVTVCNNGGREAFGIASANMDALCINSRRIITERVSILGSLRDRPLTSRLRSSMYLRGLDRAPSPLII